MPELERSAEAMQVCVDRWNQMKPTWPPTVAVVSASHPRCEIDVAGGYPPDHSTCSPPARMLPGEPGVCVDRTTLFSCVLGPTGAYRCPQHGERAPREFRGWNATIRDRTLVLEHPPQAWTRTPLPRWAARYPHEDGFVLPWRSGRLRAGLTLAGAVEASCLPGSESTRAKGALRCFAGDLVYDPCFPRTQPRRHVRFVAACPYEPGSTAFVRLVIAGKP